MKKDKNLGATPPRRSVVRDWEPLFEAFQDVLEWALDIAVKLAGDFEEDVEQIENVREFFRAWREGRQSNVPVSDVLFTIATILSAIELDLGIDSVSLLAPLRSMLDDPYAIAPMLHLPGASRRADPTLQIRRPLRRRNASAGFTHLAA